MRYASIEREIQIDAPPDVVFAVVSRPEHIREWWQADTEIQPTPGSSGELVWAAGDDPRAKVVPLAVVQVEPPHRFSFRWTHAADETPGDDNSLLVTFELEPNDSGTLLRFTESGFRERGWEDTVLEQNYRDHESGWDRFVPAIGKYVEVLVSGR